MFGGVGILIAVSLIALAAVLGYRTGRDQEQGPTVASLMRERAQATAEEYRSVYRDDELAQKVARLHVTMDNSGAPYFIAVLSDGRDVDSEALCAQVTDFLSHQRGLDFSPGHTELVFTAEGEMLRNFTTVVSAVRLVEPDVHSY